MEAVTPPTPRLRSNPRLTAAETARRRP